MDTVIFAIALALPLAAAVFAWIRCRARLRAKGYGPFLVTSCFLASFLACYVLVYWILIGAAGNGTNASTGTREAAWLLGTPLVWALLVAGFAYVAPARKSRRISGKRKSSMPRLLGWLAVMAGAAISLFFTWQLFDPNIVPRDQGVGALLVAVSLSLVLAVYWFGIDRRIRAAPSVLPDSEASVLYLRAFDAEQQPFVSGDRSILGRYTNQLKAHVPLARGKRNTTVQLTLEDYLEEAITAKLGAFVGLGNPADSLPADGATREYAPDAIWRERFMALAHSAKCIVIALGESDNLQWELQQIRENRLSQKLCLFTAPRIVDRKPGSLSKALRAEVARRDALAASWARTCETMRRAGYDCDPVCPGPGAAIAFDENGKSLLLTTEASTPDDYITPVADWFKTGTKTGRWMAGSCISCRATIYQRTESAESGGGLCFSCESEAELARMSGLDRATEGHPVLLSIWGLLSLAIAAWLSTFMGFHSMWLIVILWIVVAAVPWVVVVSFRATRDRLRSAPPAQATNVPAAPLEDNAGTVDKRA
jgi:hypothetical protein